MGMLNTKVSLTELRQMSALQNLPEAQLICLAALLVRQTYQPGHFIFLEGDQGGGLWFIQSGRVKIIKQALSGRVQALCLVNRGKCFGSCPLFQMDVNPATAQAIDTVTLYILPQEQLEHLLGHNPPLASALLQIYSQRLAHLARLAEGLGNWTAADRINDCLLTYADRGEAQPVVALTHEKLAELAGTVREVVTRHLTQLEKSGVIQLEPGRITLLDTGALNLPCACAG
jgi:CRP/FNR family transcriptional regulator